MGTNPFLEIDRKIVGDIYTSARRRKYAHKLNDQMKKDKLPA